MLGNAAFSLVLKFVHALIGFATIHALVKRWGLESYGTWVTMTSVAVYITMFDLGIGYGLRNHIAEAWGRNRPAEAAPYISLARKFYGGATAVGAALALLAGIFVEPFRTHPEAAGLLWMGCLAAFFYSYNTIVLQARGRFKSLAALTLITPSVWFFCVQAWPASSPLSIKAAAGVYAAGLLVQTWAIRHAASQGGHFVADGQRRMDWLELRPLLRTGLKFFALQCSALVLMNAGNFLIYHTLGSAETAQYDASSRVFSMFTLGFSVVITIGWTEISHAKARHDHRQQVRLFYLLHAAAALLGLCAFVCAAFADFLIPALTGVQVSRNEAFPFALMICVQALAFSSAVFLNAHERLRGQVIAAIASIPIFLAATLLFLRLGSGFTALPLATTVALAVPLIVCFTGALSVVFGPRRTA